MLLLHNIVSLPSEGSYGHDIWNSLVEMSDNLVNISRQWDDRKNLGLSVISWWIVLWIDIEEEEDWESFIRWIEVGK